ncbi:MAG: hypothetical protein ACEY3C_04405 [Candidatus Tisiphia sp.]
MEDPDLAAGYVVQGDILLAQGNIKGSIESYKKAYAIVKPTELGDKEHRDNLY